MGDFTPPLKKTLKANGFYFVRQGKGDHELWFSPISQKHFVIDGKIKSRHTANASLQQVGLENQF
jgi:predicted RNA binding protein YcfA (HicA-like mRNA interferase family)